MTSIVSVNILTLPNDGGSAITDLEYRVNAGAAVSLGETTTGSYPITADEGDDIQIRAVNAVGAGDWSDVKAVPAAETEDLPDLAYDVLLEAYDPDSLFSDTAGTTPAPVDGSVARVSDTSVNSNNATQGTAAARPTRRQLGDLNWLDHDGVDDRLVIAPNASWNKAGMSYVLAFRSPVAGTGTGGRLALLGNSGADGTAGAVFLDQPGGAGADSAALSNSAGLRKNNGTRITSITRADAGVLLRTGGWVIAEIDGINGNVSLFTSQGAQLTGFRQTNHLEVQHDIGFACLIPTATLDTGTNRADLVAALADKFGIAL